MKYQINDIVFDEFKGRLIIDDEEVQLGNKSLKLLSYLILHKNTLVTRENLIDNVWQQDYVSSTTITNQIFVLRKLLRDNPKQPTFLKTVPQLGYEFIASVKPIHSKELPVTASDFSSSQEIVHTAIQSPLQKRYLFLGVGFLLVFIILYLNSAIKQDNSTLTSFNLVPVTHEKGQEWSPALSPDGNYLAYTHRKNAQNFWQIHFKDIKSNASVRLTNFPVDHFSPIWSPDGNTLYFTKGTDDYCSLWQADISLGFDAVTYQEITNCGDVSSMSPIAVDNQNEWLYFSKVINKTQFIITRYNLINGNEEPLSIPGNIGFDGYSLALSPDNQWLAFLRRTSSIKSQLVLLNLHTKDVDILIDFYQILLRLSWQRDSRYIWFMNEKNQSNRLNIFTKQIDKKTQFQHKTLAPYVSNENNYIVDGDFFLSEVISFDYALPSGDNNYTVDISSSFSDYDPTPNSDLSATAFTSMRSGIQQIWIKEAEKLKQLTHFDFPTVVSDKQISPSDEKILFLKNKKLHIIDIDSQQITAHYPDLRAQSPIWSCDGNSIFVVFKENDNQNLYRLNSNSLAKEKLLSDITNIKQDCSTLKLYVMKSSQRKLFEFLPSTFDLIETGINEDITFSRNWAVQNNEFILLKDNKLTKTSLFTLNKKAIKLPLGSFKYFQLANSRIFLSRRLINETSIKQIVQIK